MEQSLIYIVEDRSLIALVLIEHMEQRIGIVHYAKEQVVQKDSKKNLMLPLWG